MRRLLDCVCLTYVRHQQVIDSLSAAYVACYCFVCWLLMLMMLVHVLKYVWTTAVMMQYRFKRRFCKNESSKTCCSAATVQGCLWVMF